MHLNPAIFAVCLTACNLPVYTAATTGSTSTGVAETTSAPSTSTGTTDATTDATIGGGSTSTSGEITSTAGSDASSTSTSTGAAGSTSTSSTTDETTTSTSSTTTDASTGSTSSSTSGTTESEFEQCIGELGLSNPCAECVCLSCVAELDACAADVGCTEIWPCVNETQCGNTLDCLGPCGDGYVQHGGPFGASGKLVQAILTCTDRQCWGQC